MIIVIIMKNELLSSWPEASEILRFLPDPDLTGVKESEITII